VDKKIKEVKSLLFLKVVDFRSRLLAFRGAGGEPPGTLRPQESRTLHSNQLDYGDEYKNPCISNNHLVKIKK
jgi:hypothetical protein